MPIWLSARETSFWLHGAEVRHVPLLWPKREVYDVIDLTDQIVVRYLLLLYAYQLFVFCFVEVQKRWFTSNQQSHALCRIFIMSISCEVKKHHVNERIACIIYDSRPQQL